LDGRALLDHGVSESPNELIPSRVVANSAKGLASRPQRAVGQGWRSPGASSQQQLCISRSAFVADADATQDPRPGSGDPMRACMAAPCAPDCVFGMTPPDQEPQMPTQELDTGPVTAHKTFKNSSVYLDLVDSLGPHSTWLLRAVRWLWLRAQLCAWGQQCSAVPVWLGRRTFRWPPCSRPEA
jgi:hypothetical protein